MTTEIDMRGRRPVCGAGRKRGKEDWRESGKKGQRTRKEGREQKEGEVGRVGDSRKT
jgi:hypothetical protein